MKLLVLSDLFVPRIGGTEIQAARLASGLKQRGHDVEVWTGRWEKGWPELDEVFGVVVRRLGAGAEVLDRPGFRRFMQVVYMSNLTRELERRGKAFDVIHVQSMRYGAAVAARFGNRRAVPVLVKETNSGAKNSYLGIKDVFLGGRLLRTLHRELRNVAVLNAAAEEEYASYPFENLRVHRCVNGISLGRFVPKAGENEPRRLLFVGRFRVEKGVQLLLEAWSRIHDRLPDWSLRIVGDGEERPNVERALATNPGRERVQLLGYLKDPTAELRAADAFVLPSAAEGMSNALLEAMAAGLPCVASDVGANAEMLADAAGWIIDELTPEGVAASLVQMARDEGERRRRGERARARVEAQYSIDASVRRFEEIYDAIRSAGQ